MSVELCSSFRRNHSCSTRSSFYRFLCTSVSGGRTPALMWVFVRTTTTRSSTNYLMTIFQLINCKCSSAFEEQKTDALSVLVPAWRKDSCDGICLMLFPALRSRRRFRFCYWLPSIVLPLLYHIFFSSFNLCTLIIMKTDSLSLLPTKWIWIMNFALTRVVLIQPAMHSQYTVKLPTVFSFTLHKISGGFLHNRFQTIIYNRAKEIRRPKWQRWPNKNSLNYFDERQKHTLAQTPTVDLPS